MSEMLKTFRTDYPMYDDVPDKELVKSIHEKMYSDISYDEFSKSIDFEQKSFVDKTIDSVLDFSDKMTTPITYADTPAVQQSTNQLKFDLNDPVPIIGRTEEYNTIATKLPHEKSMFELIEREQAGLSDSANMDEYKEFRDLSKDEQIRNVIPRNLGFGMIGEAFYEPGETEQAYEQRLQNTPVIERRRLAQAKEDDLLRQGQRAVSQDIHKTTVGADLKNVAQGMGTRAFDLAGNLAIAADIVLRHQDVNPRAKNQDMPKFEGWESPIRKTGEFLKDSGDDLGYEEGTNWEDVKFSARNKGLVNPQTYIDIAAYGFEQTVKSIPDMIAALYVMPTYVVARSAEIGEERAKNDGRERADLSDMRAAAPAALASALFERIGAKGITKAAKARIGKEMMEAGFSFVAKQGLKGATVESSTEFFQEGVLEYIGEKWGTEAKMSLSEMFDRGAGGALAGGLGGGTISSAGASVNVLNAKQGKKGARTEEIQGRQAEVDAKNIAEFNKEAERQAKDKPTIKISEEPLKKGEFRKLYLDGPVAKFTAKKKADDINRQFDLSEDAIETEFYINDAFAEDAIQEIRDLNDLISSGSLTDAEINNELSKITGVETNPSDATKDSLSNEISQLESKQSSITEDNSIRLNIINNLEKINSESLPSNLKKGIKGDIPIAWLSKEGVSIDEAAHKAWENLPDNMREQYNTLDVKNIIEEVIQSNKKDALNEAMGDPQKIKDLKKAQRDTNKKQPAKEVKSKADQGAPTTLTGEQTQERKRIDERDTRLVKVRSNVNDVADLIRGGKDLKAKPAHMKKINFELTKAMELDKVDTIKQLQKLDDELQDVGGLLKVVGARSKAGKIYSNYINSPTYIDKKEGYIQAPKESDLKVGETIEFKKERGAQVRIEGKIKSIENGIVTIEENKLYSKSLFQPKKMFKDVSFDLSDLNIRVRPTAESTKTKSLKDNELKQVKNPSPETEAKLTAEDPNIFKAKQSDKNTGRDEELGLLEKAEAPLPKRRDTIKIGDRTVKIPKKTQRLEPIRRKFISLIGPRFYNGRIRDKETKGYYNQRTGEVRNGAPHEIEIKGHEVAHFLDLHANQKNPEFSKHYESPKYSDEMKKLSYTNDSNLRLKEGFAEFVRLWLTQSETAKKHAPKFYSKFNELIKENRKLNKKMLALQDMMHKYYWQGEEAIGDAAIGENKSFIDKAIDLVASRPLSRAVQIFLDSGYGLFITETKTTGKLGEAEESAWKINRMRQAGLDEYTETFLQDETFIFENGEIKHTGVGLKTVLNPLIDVKLNEDHKGQEVSDLWSKYMIGVRSLDLRKQGRENRIHESTAKAWKELGNTYPEFKEVAKEYYAWSDRVQLMLVTSGVISIEEAKINKEANPHHVPFYRVSESGLSKPSSTSGSPLKKLTGGTANINDLLLNIQEMVSTTINSAMLNMSKTRLLQYITTTNDGSIFGAPIPSSHEMVSEHTREAINDFKKMMKEGGTDTTNMDFDALIDPDDRRILLYSNKPRMNEDGNIIDMALVNGKPHYFEASDALLQQTLLSMSPEGYGALTKGAIGVKNILTIGVTSAPGFIEANILRDTLGGAVVSTNGFVPFYSSARGLVSFLRKDNDYKEYKRGGVGGSGLTKGLTPELTIRRKLGIKKNTLKDIPRLMWQLYATLRDATEGSTRIGLQAGARRAGKSPMESAFLGMEGTTNFATSGGGHEAMRWIKQAEFLNAFLVSMEKMRKDLSYSKDKGGKRAQYLIKGTMFVTAPVLFSWLAFKDDEDYQKQSEYWKNTNIPLYKDDEGTFHSIPLPYDVGYLFGTIPRLTMQYIKDDKGDKYAEGVAWTMAQMMHADLTPAWLGGPKDIVLNETWTGAPIVPHALKDVESVEQYTERTSPAMIELGQKLNLSPIKAEYLFKSYTGTMGTHMLDVVDKMYWDKDKFGEMPEETKFDNIFIKRFLRSNNPRRTTYEGQFFDRLNASNKYYKTISLNSDVRRLITKSNKTDSDEFFKDDALGFTSKQKMVLSQLNKELGNVVKELYGKGGMKDSELVVKYNKDLSAKEKRTEIEEITKERNNIIEDSLKEIDRILISTKTEK